jgi:hypothetical protein
MKENFMWHKIKKLFKKRIKPAVPLCVTCKVKKCPDNPKYKGNIL